MDSEDSYRNISSGQFRAQGIINAVNSYLKLADRDRGSDAITHTLSEAANTEGGELTGYQEETREHLVKPVLYSLGYESLIELQSDLGAPHQPVPDFRLDTSQSECNCIVEIASFGYLAEDPDVNTDLKSVMETYMEANPETPYPHGQYGAQPEYLIAIATDGIVWELHGTHLESDTTFPVTTVSLRETYQTAVNTLSEDDDTSDRWVVEERDYVHDTFLPVFTEEELVDAFNMKSSPS
ncbi:hypothetical protein [Salinibaculum rarum]|uniref:hypothetical protein n=1 Tax=Salinibaculum rarum TaxID=3058903 RepID=UPI00265FC6E9|nr:hypothetical protein [Salinibaculum sp. KK48]